MKSNSTRNLAATPECTLAISPRSFSASRLVTSPTAASSSTPVQDMHPQGLHLLAAKRAMTAAATGKNWTNTSEQAKNTLSADFNKLYIQSAVAGGSKRLKSMLLNISKNFEKSNPVIKRASLVSPPTKNSGSGMVFFNDGVPAGCASPATPVPFLSPREGAVATAATLAIANDCLMLESSCAQLQGRRPYMEDRFLIENNFLDCAKSHPSVKDLRDLLPSALYNEMPKLMSVFGVFDGHGGSNAVNFITSNVIDSLIEAFLDVTSVSSNMYKESFIEMLGGENDAHDSFIKTVLNHACKDLETQITHLSKTYKWKSGSCFVLSLVVDSKLYVANIGDSRVVALDGAKVMPLSIDHNPCRMEEKSRILKAGGDVRKSNGTYRVYPGGIAVARALGDYPIKLNPNVLSAEPEITVKQLGPSFKCLVMASDGVWDVLSNPEAISIIAKSKGANEAAEKIVNRAYERMSNDNLTALVVRFQSVVA